MQNIHFLLDFISSVTHSLPLSLFSRWTWVGWYHNVAIRDLTGADRGQLQTPRYRLTTSGGRSFTCAASSTWNALPDYLKHTALSLSNFEKQLKTILLSRY